MDSNKIKGALMGYAIGDALGIGTEFMTRTEVNHRYPEGLKHYSQIVRDAHRSQWPRGTYTADTETLLQLIHSLLDKRKPDYMDFARRLKEWFLLTDGQDAGPHIRLVILNENYVNDPHATSREIYTKRQYFEAHNEALGRAMFLGLLPGSRNELEKNVADNVKTTHFDTRCVATGIIMATMANDLLWNNRETDYQELINIADRIDPRVTPYVEKAYNGTIEDFELDDEDTLWYTRKSMGAALWFLNHYDDTEKALYDIVAIGGDADTNGALVAALFGLKYGLDSLPQNLVNDHTQKDYIFEIADKFSNLIESMSK